MAFLCTIGGQRSKQGSGRIRFQTSRPNWLPLFASYLA